MPRKKNPIIVNGVEVPEEVAAELVRRERSENGKKGGEKWMEILNADPERKARHQAALQEGKKRYYERKRAEKEKSGASAK